MAYELELLDTGQRMALHTQDWENLLGLARRHGWRPSADVELRPEAGRRTIGVSEAQELAQALESPLSNLPPERRQELRPTELAPGGLFGAVSRAGSETDYEGYFAWQRRWIIEEVARLCRQGAVEVRPM